MFLGHFWPFLPHVDFFQIIRLSQKTIYGPPTPCWVSEKTNEPILKKLTDRQKDGRTDRPYFIGPFRPRLGVQKANTGFFFLNNNITKKQNFTAVSGFSLEPHWQDESFSSFFRVTQGLRSLQICIFRLIFLEILCFSRLLKTKCF